MIKKKIFVGKRFVLKAQRPKVFGVSINAARQLSATLSTASIFIRQRRFPARLAWKYNI
jgi:hypothetical protein